MASSFFYVRLGMLHELGGQLRDVSGTIKSGAVFPDVPGAEHYSDLSSAVGDFKTDWENATKRLVEAIGNWGDKATGIGKFMDEHDQQLAAALRGEER